MGAPVGQICSRCWCDAAAPSPTPPPPPPSHTLLYLAPRALTSQPPNHPAPQKEKNPKFKAKMQVRAAHGWRECKAHTHRHTHTYTHVLFAHHSVAA